MPVTIQAIYPVGEGLTFDYDYYVATHLPLVQSTMGPAGLSSVTASKGLAGGPGVPPAYYAVATMTFPDEAAMNACLAVAGPVLADIPNFTTCTPNLLIGAVIY